MLLKLKYSDTANHHLAGALIRGSKPEIWLEEISRWGISAAELECYVMPESIQSVQAGGLFVCFTVSKPHLNLLQQPYGRVGERLYLPLHAELHPDMKDEELRAAFLWERQVFHPVVGMVGFEKNNRFNPVSLLNFPSSLGRDWSQAKAGLSPVPALESIGLDRPPMQDFLQQTQDVGSKSLKDLPGGKAGEGSNMAQDLQKGALKGMKGILDSLNKAFSSGGTAGGDGKFTYEPRSGGGAGQGGSAGGGGFSFKPGLFARMQDWLDQRIEDLESKRRSELERLMDLFESDPDAALKYAIPLGGDYFNRGIAPPSASLGARSTNFNLGELGGGKPVDGWNVDGYESKLRERYLAAANKEVEAGEYRKAAYIHAHLLHNFTAAANVLEQGRFYREAAVLYKDHLKDPAAAAECLERGGLLLDAIEMYVEMGKREKAADLYTTLKQKDKADVLYQACADDALAKWDFLEAGRLYLEKMDRPEKAMENYHEGWKKEAQSEACLVRYFDLYKEHGKADIEVRLENLYREETPSHRRETFFRVLLQQRPKWEGEEVIETIDEIAFEIISEQASAGNFVALDSIQTFVPDDQLIRGDSHRYKQVFKDKPAPPSAPIEFNLPENIVWGHAVGLKDSLLAIGCGEEGEICLARVNWEGYVEMTRLPGTISQAGDRLMVDLAVPDVVLVLPETMQKIPTRVLGPGLKFKLSLAVSSPPGYNRDTLAVGLDSKTHTYLLDTEPNERRSTLHHYDDLRNLKRAELPSRNINGNTRESFTFLHPIVDRSIRFFKEDMFLVSGPFLLSRKSGDSDFVVHALLKNQNSHRPDAFFPSLAEMESTPTTMLEPPIVSLNNWKISPYAKKLTMAFAGQFGAFVMTDFTEGEGGLNLHFFEDEGFKPNFIEFLPGMFLLIAGAGFVQVYDLMNGKPEFLKFFTIEEPIIAIMPTDLRCQFAVVLASGKIKLFEFDRY